jgi:hypothetical protein
MYSWITTKDLLDYDREARIWGFAKSRDHLFEGEIKNSVRDMYAKLCKMVHGSSRIANFSLIPPDEMIENTWDNLYWLGLNSLLVMIYAFRDYLPLQSEYQKYIKQIVNTYGLPDDILESNKLPDLPFGWLENNF